MDTPDILDFLQEQLDIAHDYALDMLSAAAMANAEWDKTDDPEAEIRLDKALEAYSAAMVSVRSLKADMAYWEAAD